MRVLVALLCAACGSPGSPNLTPDAPEPDGPGCEDSDGNGVCDIDLCPDVPGMDLSDPDGDGFAWSCDPVESFGLGHGGFINGVVARDTFAAIAGFCPNGNPCERSVVAANARGHAIASLDSGDPADAWLAQFPVIGPFVTSAGRVILSRGEAGLDVGDVGEFDPVSRSYTAVVAGSVERADRAIFRGNETVAMMVRTTSQHREMVLLEPQANGDLLTIATAPGGFVSTSSSSVPLQLVGSSTLIPVRSVTPSETFDLKTFTIGAGSLEPTSVAGAGRLFESIDRQIVGYTSETQSSFAYSELTSDGLVSGAVPGIVSDIALPLRGGRVLRSSDNTGLSTGVSVIRDGAIHSVFGNGTHIVNEVSGDSSVVLVGRDAQGSHRVWEVAPDNTTRMIADGLREAHASAVACTK